MSRHPAICFIIPYFGKWPFWFEFFLTSCAWNPKIHWLIYTDCGLPENIPDNMKFVETSFQDYCALVSKQLEIGFRPERPYKLCDIKVALGNIHDAELAEYDFFGFCDIDVVFGDLYAYLAPRIAKYNLVTTHATRVAGHLTVMRNTQEMRDAFQVVPNWQAEFEKEENVRFDEKHFSKIFLRHKNWPAWLRKVYDQADFYRRTSLLEESYSTPECAVPWHDGSKNFPTEWYCRPGSLKNNLDGDREFPYLHFLWWKGYGWPDKAKDQSGLVQVEAGDLKNGWMITESGFSSLPMHAP